MWNVLLAQYHFSLIPSKWIRTNFAQVVSDAYEVCGTNAPHESEMDYHNNAIGRKIYNDNTSYLKFFGIPIAVIESSVSLLKIRVRDYINTKSCYIIKQSYTDSNGNIAHKYTDSQLFSLINSASGNTSVYYTGTIAPYGLRKESYIDYSNCEIIEMLIGWGGE